MEVAEGAAPAPAQQEAPVEQEAAEPEAPPAEETEEEKQAKMTQAVAELLAQKTALLEVTRAAAPRCVPLHAWCLVISGIVPGYRVSGWKVVGRAVVVRAADALGVPGVDASEDGHQDGYPGQEAYGPGRLANAPRGTHPK
jgi:hypothetical protein